MDLLLQYLDSVVTLLVIVVMGYLLKERLDRIDARFDDYPTKGEVLPRLDRLEREVDALRSDITQIALAVGARSRPQTG